MMEAMHNEPGSGRTGERGFTMIEVMVALVLVAMVGIAAATTMAGAGRAQGTAKVRDRQAAAAQSILARLRNDSSWSHQAACKNSVNTHAPCILSSSLSSDPSLNYGTAGRFQVTASAIGVDLPGDNDAAGHDIDGVLPDVYRVTVKINQPIASSTVGTIAGIQPLIVSSDVNFSDAAVTGSVKIYACKVNASIDERAPIANCPAGNATILKMDAPGNFDPAHPGNCNSKDCIAWRCASSAYRSGYCPAEFRSHGGAADSWISETIRALTGGGIHYSLNGAAADTNTHMIHRGGYLSAVDGYSDERNLPPGQYDIHVDAPAGMIPWLSHSLPASGHLSVVAGSTSRYIAMYKPGPASSIKLRVNTTDSTAPWAPMHYNYAYETSVCGLLVAAPIGRAEMANPGRSPFTDREYCANPGDEYLTINNPEPGLYLPYLTDNTFTSWKLITDTPGYLLVPGSNSSALIELGHCDPDGRDALIAVYGHERDIPYTNPVTGVTTVSHYLLPSCRSTGGGGPSPPPGGGTRGG